MKKLTMAMGLFAAACAWAEIPLPEHPRPDFERAEWLNLNGEWDFGFSAKKLDQKIVVPFCWGSKLSGVADKGDTGWYRRTVTVPEAWKGKRVFVVVGASDHDTTCTFAGETLGTYSGGYVPFEFELTEFVKWGEAQTLEFKVWDPSRKIAGGSHHLYGKQGYGNARGIWQTVYLEARGNDYVDSVRFYPNIAKSSVRAAVSLGAPVTKPTAVKVAVKGLQAAEITLGVGERDGAVEIPVAAPHLWTLDDPFLYEATVTVGDDAVATYFGFREVGVGKNPNGDSYVTLNGKPIYLQLTLDQSYHPDGFYTFPTDEFMKNEILLSKRLALSGNRVHIKVEMPRKLYWADKLGLLIQADVPNAWGDASEAMFEEHWKCFEAMVKRDFNHPCIYQWTLFNETWGLFSNRSIAMGLASGGKDKKQRKFRDWTQRRVADAYYRAKALDPTRLVEDNSPCNHDHVVTDVNTWHYYRPGWDWERIVNQKCTNTFAGSAYDYIGGHVQRDEPMMNSECGNVWGYKGSAGDSDFTWDYHMMINAFRRHLKCAGWLYTEHHDVINEWNGYVRFDRTEKEFGLEDLFPGMTIRDFHADAYLPLGLELFNKLAPGATMTVPVDVSLTTDRYAGKAASLSYRLRYFDGEGKLCETEPTAVALADATLRAWQCGRLADVAVTLPDGPACGTANFALTVDGQTVARNFQCFATEGAKGAEPTKAEWSLKEWTVMGEKRCGTGTGYYEYVFDAPKGGVFRAEVSAKRLNGKDIDEQEKVKIAGVDWMLGGGSYDRTKNPNSYPQTTVAHKFPGQVKVYANGEFLKTVALADDPADHRGILSWGAQAALRDLERGSTLNEAGSYGYLVEAEIPASLAKDGKVTVRLEAEKTGLAVYGPGFGRYPMGPHVAEK